MRKLKYHEKKLLKKVDFINWKVDEDYVHEVAAMRKFKITHYEYTAYSKLAREVRTLAGMIFANEKKPYGILAKRQLCQKLYDQGIITSQSLGHCMKVSTVSFCQRRLSAVVLKTKMTETMDEAVKYIEHGHIRIGTECVKDPAMLVTRNMQDFLTWCDTSAIKRKIVEYNEMRDDYDLLE